MPQARAGGHGGERFMRRYGVNVFVAHEDGDGAPVVVETNPSYQSLFGRIEFESVFGAVATDHGQSRCAGAVHRANGGYLVLRTLEVLSRPLVWEQAQGGAARRPRPAREPGRAVHAVPHRHADPRADRPRRQGRAGGHPGRPPAAVRARRGRARAVPRARRVRRRVLWSDDRVREYAGFVAGRVRQHGLRHFDATAVARVVEHGARVAGDQRRLSTRFDAIADLVAEASHWAAAAGARGGDAGRRRARRSRAESAARNLVEERMDELIADGHLMIAVDGERVGQVNGLSVIELGDYAFGRPTRITATTAAGRGGRARHRAPDRAERGRPRQGVPDRCAAT